MFLQLNHQKMDVYAISRKFVNECYKMTKRLPPEERFAMCSQVRRAALSVHLNIAEGCSRKSAAERRRYYEISRGSVIEIDAALDIIDDLAYCKREDLTDLGTYMVRCFSMLCKMIGPAD